MTALGDDGRAVGLSGLVSVGDGDDTALVVVHGLGGDARSHYCVRAARAAARRGWTCLRLNLRGADGSGEDLYHAGLASDVSAALASPELAGHRRRFVLGYSLGGHVALHAARADAAGGLAAVVAVCAPLALRRGADVLDAPRSWLYRRHILGSLQATYARYAERHPEAASPERVGRVRTIRSFDALTVVPRFGFADVDEYYRSQSVAPHLATLERPTLLVYARHDPVVPQETVSDLVQRASSATEVWWIEKGGHVGFPGRPARGRPTELEDELLDWLDARAR
jgi:predicted alpha/beta-fold hydrolase